MSKKISTVISLLLVLAVILTTLAGCSTPEQTTIAAETTVAESDSLEFSGIYLETEETEENFETEETEVIVETEVATEKVTTEATTEVTTEATTEATTEVTTEATTEATTETTIETTEAVTETTEAVTETETESMLVVTPEKLEGDYFYNYLSTLDKGEDYLELYHTIDSLADRFYAGELGATAFKIGENTLHYFAIVDFSSYGFTIDDAGAVLQLYIYDHPFYYWLSGSYIYTSKSIYLCVIDDYIDFNVREKYDALIFKGVADMAAQVQGVDSAYTTALAYHDMIISAVDYAYEDDCVTPQDDPWAHNIIGFFDGGKGVVCEGYADVFSLLLNFSGIENILVPGIGDGGLHIWNLVRLDDGEWYWCDITWDDNPSSEWGIEYQYFCVGESENVYKFYRDGGYNITESATFLDLHTVQWVGNEDFDMSGVLPERATDAFGSDELTLRETFEKDGFTYAIAGYRTVQLVAISGGGSILIPESVVYDGVEYTVIAIGGIGSDGVYNGSSVISREVTAVTIPSTVRYIWYKAFSSTKLQAVTFDADNEGVIIGAGAFLGCSRLSSLTLCKNILLIGDSAFSGCSLLRTITYLGTVADWGRIGHEKGWSTGITYSNVKCTDGRAALI